MLEAMKQRYWKFDMFLETFRLGACAISNLEQSPYKNNWGCFSFSSLWKNVIIKGLVLYQWNKHISTLYFENSVEGVREQTNQQTNIDRQ